LHFCEVLGIDVLIVPQREIEAEMQAKGRGCNLGFFRKDVGPLGSSPREGTIAIRQEADPKERLEILAHELGHGYFALGPLHLTYQKWTHEPVADLFGKCLVATLRGETGEFYGFQIRGMQTLVLNFLHFISEKLDSTFQGNLETLAAYERLKEEEAQNDIARGARRGIGVEES
jgi:hypothetical protein